MRDDLNLGEYRVLRALCGGARYGFEIRKAIQNNQGGDPLSLAAIYMVLRRLEEKKWVKGRWANDEEESLGARRRIYDLTEVGERAFGGWREMMKALAADPETSTQAEDDSQDPEFPQASAKRV
jgi:DNA-binding PadR family transcriptional regulator